MTIRRAVPSAPDLLVSVWSAGGFLIPPSFLLWNSTPLHPRLRGHARASSLTREQVATYHAWDSSVEGGTTKTNQQGCKRLHYLSTAGGELPGYPLIKVKAWGLPKEAGCPLGK